MGVIGYCNVSSAVPGGLGLFLSFPGTCFAACRAIFIRAFRRSVHGQPWELFEPAMFGDVAKLCLYAESRFAPEGHGYAVMFIEVSTRESG